MEYKNTKLINFLRTFSQKDFSEFENFLQNSYQKSDRNLLPFLKILKSFYPDFSSDNLTEKYISSELKHDDSYSYKKSKDIIRTLSSSLMKAVEEFLCTTGFINNGIIKNRILLEEIISRNLIKHFDKYSKKAEEDIIAREKNYSYNILENYQLEKINSGYYSSISDYENFYTHNFKSLEFISAAYWIELFNAGKIMLLSRDNRKEGLQNDFLNKLLNISDIEKIPETFKGSKYYTKLCFSYFILQCIKNNRDKNYFNSAKKIFFDNRNKISRYEKNYYYSDLISIVHRGTEANIKNERRELFEILKSCVEDKGYKLSDKDFMHPNFYRDVLLTSDSLREYDWVDGFVDKYSKELRPDIRESMYNYSKALLNYGKGEFEKSLEYVSKIKYAMVFFKTDLKILMIRIYYELNLTEQAVYLADTFKHHIKISKYLNNEYRNAFNNYLNYFIKLIKLRAGADVNKKNESEILIKQIEKEKHIVQRSWLIEKLNLIKSTDKK